MFRALVLADIAGAMQAITLMAVSQGNGAAAVLAAASSAVALGLAVRSAR